MLFPQSRLLNSSSLSGYFCSYLQDEMDEIDKMYFWAELYNFQNVGYVNLWCFNPKFCNMTKIMENLRNVFYVLNYSLFLFLATPRTPNTWKKFVLIIISNLFQLLILIFIECSAQSTIIYKFSSVYPNGFISTSGNVEQ